MATKKRVVRKSTPRREERREYRRKSVSRRISHKSADMMKKIKWGEAGVMGLLGYFVGPALQKSGIANAVGSELASKSSMMGNLLYHEGSGIPGEQMAKLGGGLLTVDVLHDVVKKYGQVDDKDINVKIPLALGMILDPKSEYGSKKTGGRW